MKFIGIIPARYASTRFPGKPLVDINGKSMIQHVYEQASKVLEHVVVATDDKRIKNEIESFGGNVVLTSTKHRSGTDRCLEAYNKYKILKQESFDVVINIQGDEPFIHPEQIKLLQQCFNDPETQIATLIKEIENNEDIFNPNKPKVVLNKSGFAIYFSRSAIPNIRNKDHSVWQKEHTFYKHIGIYAYLVEVLEIITQIPSSNLEIAESLEQLRWIENGYNIKTAITTHESISVDTPEDLANILKTL